MSNTAATGASNLTTLCALANISDKRLAEMMGVTRQTAYNKRTGRSALDLNDLDLFARILEVPVTAFLMERDQLLRWVADHGWEGPKGVRSRCFSATDPPRLPGFNGDVWIGAAAAARHEVAA
jgi:hypothetical protein